jgi:hypothetical protein
MGKILDMDNIEVKYKIVDSVIKVSETGSSYLRYFFEDDDDLIFYNGYKSYYKTGNRCKLHVGYSNNIVVKNNCEIHCGYDSDITTGNNCEIHIYSLFLNAPKRNHYNLGLYNKLVVHSEVVLKRTINNRKEALMELRSLSTWSRIQCECIINGCEIEISRKKDYV